MITSQSPLVKLILKRWFLVLPVCGVAVAALFFLGGGGNKKESAKTDKLVTAPVSFGKFVQEVVELGEIESSSNVEVRCEINTGPGGLAILEIVPEGTYVQPGDFLCRLDDADLQSRLVTRQIDVNGSRAALAQAKADLQNAILALEEYKAGTFREQEEQMESDVFVSRENQRRAEEYLRYSQRLSEKGYVSEVQLEADRFAVEKASKELEVSNTKLEVLRTFTKEKMLTQLSANIETNQARLSSAERAFKIDNEQLAEVEAQIAKCLIKAPSSGQVVYANAQTSTGEALIEEGKSVRERQEIIRLPDPKRMQVFAEVNESRIDKIQPGMTAKILVDALPGQEFKGELVKVTEYPLPRKNAYMSHIKNYGATIMITNPPASLRPGMTAQAAILVREEENALQVPVAAVIEREKRYFCLVNDAAHSPALRAREVAIGAANENFVLVQAGLQQDEQVVLGPDAYIDGVELPDPAILSQALNAKNQPLAATVASKN